MTTMMMFFWDLHTAYDDDDGGGDDDDDDDDDNDNDDNYDDDDDAFLGLTLVAPDRPSTAKTLTDDYTILDSGTRPYMPGKRATSRVERAIMLLTALKPNRMGA